MIYFSQYLTKREILLLIRIFSNLNILLVRQVNMEMRIFHSTIISKINHL